MNSETIAAIATAMTNSGIGIIRLSGDEAISVADKIYVNHEMKHTLKNYKTHTIHYGYVVDPHEKDKIVDEVMISVMKAPNSYTKEDVVEINCHGGVLIMQRTLNLVLQNGAKLAEPGEFTKRAFLNGRIDLSKAEAVMDLIDSNNRFAMETSLKQLKGSVLSLVKKMRADILYEIAFIESALDDPEHISLEGFKERLKEKVCTLLKETDELIRDSKDGRILKEGIRTVIVGKPNAGKSSLLNRMLGQDRAIVTDIAGTTRDALEETVLMDGISLNLIDTAGIRSTEDVVERIGVEKAKEYVKDADLVLYVVDVSVPLDENDHEILSYFEEKKGLILLNKSDLDAVICEKDLISLLGEKQKENVRIIPTSTKEQTGLDKMKEEIKAMFVSGKMESEHHVFLSNARQIGLMEEVNKSLLQVQDSLEMDMPEDFYSIDLMNAYASLGYIIGEEVSDDLVNEIFSKFCMGK